MVTTIDDPANIHMCRACESEELKDTCARSKVIGITIETHNAKAVGNELELLCSINASLENT